MQPPKNRRKPSRDRFGTQQKTEAEISPTRKGLLIKKRTTTQHPVDRVYGILGKDALGEGVSVDEYIEEIRGSGWEGDLNTMRSGRRGG